MTLAQINEEITSLEKQIKTEDILLASVLEKLDAYKDQAKRILIYKTKLKARIEHYENLKSSLS